MKTLPETTAQPVRLDYLDAVRAFALLLGVVFHASLSFLPIPIGWAVMDISTGQSVGGFILISHSFRMALFFLIAGFFSHMSFHRKGTGTFLRTRLVRLGVPFVIGWFILWPLIVSGWIMGAESMRGEVHVMAGLIGGFQVLRDLPAGIFTQTHLWFLYYLMMITTMVLGSRMLLKLTGRGYDILTRRLDSALAWLASRPCGIWAFILPTAGILWLMNGWGMDTPDKSLVPDLPVTLVYGGFFSLGWLLHRNRDSFEELTRLTAGNVVLAVIASTLSVILSSIQADPSHPHFMAARAAFVLCYATMMWSLVLVSIGLFRKLIRRTYPCIRYIADASYWIYLIHLPVVVWLQVLVAEWPLHWLAKLAGVSLTSILIGLVTYGLLVRYSWIGRLLHGRRVSPGKAAEKAISAPALTEQYPVR